MSADLIARMVAEGMSAQLVADVAMALARADADRQAISARRANDRERQSSRRHAMSRDVTGDSVTARDVTVDTPSPSPSPFLPPDPQPTPAPTHTPANTTRARGARLAADWEAPEDWLLWAMQDRDWNRVDAESEANTFHDHWIAKPGKEACKLDWQATWRNWVRNSRRQGRNGQRSHHNGHAVERPRNGLVAAAADYLAGSPGV